MSEELFTSIPESEPSALDAARARYAEAHASWLAAADANDLDGTPVPSRIAEEYAASRRAVMTAESAELKRRTQQ